MHLFAKKNGVHTCQAKGFLFVKILVEGCNEMFHVGAAWMQAQKKLSELVLARMDEKAPKGADQG